MNGRKSPRAPDGDPTGTTMDQVAARESEFHHPSYSDTTGTRRYQFADGSAIVVSESFWDVGFPNLEECLCWAGSREHNGDCPYRVFGGSIGRSVSDEGEWEEKT